MSTTAKKTKFPRPVMIEAWKAQLEITKRNKETKATTLDAEWIEQNGLFADPKTNLFPDNCALKEAPFYLYDLIILTIMTFPLYSFFFWIPALIWMCYAYYSWPYATAIVVGSFVTIYSLPCERWPPSLRYTYWMEGGLRYFSYRFLIEEEIDHTTPAIYTTGPHGVAFALSPSIVAVLNETLLGAPLHMLTATAAFYVPFYNVLLKLMGFISVDRHSFLGALKKGRSVCLIPGGIAEMFVCSYGNEKETLSVKTRIGFVKIALETGSQIVPCYCFGNSQTFSSGSGRILRFLSRALKASLVLFWGRGGLPVPYHVPMLTVIGR